MVGFVLGGIFTDALSGAVAALIGFTGLFGGAAHYAAVLAGRSEREVERAHRDRLLPRLRPWGARTAGAGIAVAALGLVAVASGAALGYFADRLPESAKARRRNPDGTERLAGAHHGHR